MGLKETILAPHIDTDLVPHEFDDKRWDQSQPVRIQHYWSGEQAPSEKHAEVRLLWSDHALHVRFNCNQQEPIIVSNDPQLFRKTLGLWNRDVCEIFIAPFADQPGRYFEFEAAPTGEWVDLAVQFNENVRESDFEYSSGFTVAARLAQDQITIGMHIPLGTTIPQPSLDDEWRVNLFRCVGLGKERYLAWQPTFTEEPNFHVPDFFGTLRFV